MRFIVTKDYEELSQVISTTFLNVMHHSKERVNICVTTGTTPIRAYKILAPLVKDKAYFNHVHYYVVDEFWYKGNHGEDDIPVNKMSMDIKFFEDANIPQERIHTLTDQNLNSFDEDIQRYGGMDAVVMGIGPDGHFCGNYPDTFENWNEGSHKIDRYRTSQIDSLLLRLLEEDIHSKDEARIPDHYLTMGPKTMMDAKHIIMIFTGKEKAPTVKRAFFESIDMNFPVSIFQLHQNVTILLDEDAASDIQEYLYRKEKLCELL